MKALPIQFAESIPAWEKAISAFLAEKERRSGSMRTVDACTRTLQHFFGTTGKTPEQVTPRRSTRYGKQKQRTTLKSSARSEALKARCGQRHFHALGVPFQVAVTDDQA